MAHNPTLKSATRPRKEILRRSFRLVTGPDEWGSVYIYFNARNAKSKKMRKFTGEANLDYDSQGRLIGIELLDVTWKLP